MPTGPRPQPPNRCVRVGITGGFDTINWANVLWLFVTGSGEITHADLNELANGIFGKYADRFMPHLSNSCFLDSVQVVLWQDDDQIVAYSDTANVVGGTAGSANAANVALCITWPIAAHYKGGHPRTYLCGLPTAARANPTTWDADYADAVESSADSFHSQVETLGPIGDGITAVEHGIVSFVSGGLWRDPPVFRRILPGAHVDSRVDTMRRRLGPDRA